MLILATRHQAPGAWPVVPTLVIVPSSTQFPPSGVWMYPAGGLWKRPFFSLANPRVKESPVCGSSKAPLGVVTQGNKHNPRLLTKGRKDGMDTTGVG